MFNVAKKFASDTLRSSAKNSKTTGLIGRVASGTKRNLSNDDSYNGQDPRFLIIVDEEMKAQREEIQKSPEMLQKLQNDPSNLDVNVTALQKNIINRLKNENSSWTKTYIDQLTKEMEEMSKTPENEGRGR